MNETILLFWVFLWVIFLVMSIIEQRGMIFGHLAGLWIMFLGIYIYLDGLQYNSGVEITEQAGTQIISYTYTEIIPPFSNYGMLWAVPFILLGIYIEYLATTKNRVRA